MKKVVVPNYKVTSPQYLIPHIFIFFTTSERNSNIIFQNINRETELLCVRGPVCARACSCVRVCARACSCACASARVCVFWLYLCFSGTPGLFSFLQHTLQVFLRLSGGSIHRNFGPHCGINLSCILFPDPLLWGYLPRSPRRCVPSGLSVKVLTSCKNRGSPAQGRILSVAVPYPFLFPYRANVSGRPRLCTALSLLASPSPSHSPVVCHCSSRFAGKKPARCPMSQIVCTKELNSSLLDLLFVEDLLHENTAIDHGVQSKGNRGVSGIVLILRIPSCTSGFLSQMFVVFSSPVK